MLDTAFPNPSLSFSGFVLRRSRSWLVLLQFFTHHGVEIKVLSLPTREANKDFELVYEIARELEEFGINR